MERAIQRYEKWVKDRVVMKLDIFLGNCYLLECALNVASVERDFTFGCIRACVVTAVEAVKNRKTDGVGENASL